MQRERTGGLIIADDTLFKVNPGVRKGLGNYMDEYSKNGWFIVIVGDEGYGEVKAIVGCADKYKVILTEKEAEKFTIPEKTLVIAQTTFSLDEYQTICEILIKKDPSVKVIKSICPATRQRQESLKRTYKYG